MTTWFQAGIVSALAVSDMAYWGNVFEYLIQKSPQITLPLLFVMQQNEISLTKLNGSFGNTTSQHAI